MEQKVIKMMQEKVPGFNNYNRHKKATLFRLFQGGRIKIGENDEVVDPASRIEEWTDIDWGDKCKGSKKGGKRQGIVREVGSDYIELKQYSKDKLHGLSIT